MYYKIKHINFFFEHSSLWVINKVLVFGFLPPCALGLARATGLRTIARLVRSDLVVGYRDPCHGDMEHGALLEDGLDYTTRVRLSDVIFHHMSSDLDVLLDFALAHLAVDGVSCDGAGVS